MKIGFAGDHAGYLLAQPVQRVLEARGIEFVNFGTFGPESVDYPDFAHKLASAVENGEVDLGIAACGTGNGMAMSLNKHKGIRAGLAWNKEIAELVKAHNNANILVLSQRFVSEEENLRCVEAWLDTAFMGERHQRRIDKIPFCGC
ncbi:MAG: RpiB/LacA/LacB family sugar-phosphate isomerase [Bacteroidales bacterium]|nr:RpiB/LacA/LacB family sugar-phosphate isomerase [Bacteroidales bacterium]